MKYVLAFMLFICNIAFADINSGLVAHWTFDNDSNIVFDKSGNRHHAHSFNVDYEDGIINKAARFNSARDKIIISDSSHPLDDDIAKLDSGTISVWFKYENFNGQVYPIFYYGESSSDEEHNSLIIEIGHNENLNNQKLYFTIVNSRFCYDSKDNLEEDKWYHFAAVVSSTGNSGYLNGEEQTERNYNLGSDVSYTNFFSSVTTNELCALGYGRYGLNDIFLNYNGLIDDVRIYNRPLTSEEVKELYESSNTIDNSRPTFENVAYGPYERNVLDFWKADSERPTPLVIYIHGGGFVGGDKSGARTGSHLENINRCLENGVSFAAINYRFVSSTRLDTIMFDAARAIQFLRYKSDEWNINKDKIASYGGSAGGGATIWLAFNDDLADPVNSDPILRESTRLTVGGHLTSQATYNLLRWAEILGMSDNWFEEMNYTGDLDVYHIPDRSWYDSLETQELIVKLDMVAMIDRSDPPMFYQNGNKDIPPTNHGQVHHHPKHTKYLQHIYDSLGLDNAISLFETPQNERPDMLDFFFKYLLEQTEVEEDIEKSAVLIYPNPARDYIELKNLTLASSQAEREFELSIYNVLGRSVKCKFQKEIAPHSPQGSGYTTIGGWGCVIDISHLQPGIYFVRVGNEFLRFVKI